MSIDYQGDVAKFHAKFGLPCPPLPQPMSADMKALRKRLIREEAEELCDAIDSDDPAKIAQETCDVLYVALGAAVVAGVAIDPAWELVQAANMRKVLPPEGTNGKIIKPPGWVSPVPAIREIYGGKA